jgi:drug/metabolite transporter (DMT)-like permease
MSQSLQRTLLLILPPLIWASLIVVGAKSMTALPAFALTFWSWLVAGVILSFLALPDLRASLPTIWREWPRLLLLGACGTTGFQYLWFAGLMEGHPANVAILSASLPTMVALGAHLWLKELHWLPISVACLCSLLAAFLLIAGDGQGATRFTSGDLLIIAANVLMTIYTLGCRRWPTALPPLTFMAATTVAGLLVLTLFGLIQGLSAGSAAAVVEHWPALLYLGAIAYALAYVIWNRSVLLNGAARTGLFLALQPVFALAFAVLWLGADVNWQHILALFLTVLGLFIVYRTERKNV